MTSSHKEEWGTRVGVILAVAGSAVGLGNFLRFPGQAAQNGGGAFLIPYFCALLLLGIPLGWAEWAMGRYGGAKGFHSAPGILGVISGRSWGRYLGVIGALIPLVVSFYYVFIESWTFGYFLTYLTGGIGIDPSTSIAEQTAVSSAFYTTYTGANADGALLGGDLWLPVLSWVVVFAVNIFFVYRGISKGIEKFCTWAMPAMAVCAFIVLIRVLTLGTPDPAQPERNVVNGLAYMWNPDFSALTNFQTWLAAAGQIFFSTAVGFGIILNYASYLRRRSDVALSALTSTSTNELFEIGFGGMITLTASFVFLGLAGTTAAVSTGSFSLGFQTLPVVFAHMGGLGNLVGALWFFMLFLAAVTSSLSMYQPAVAFIMESMGWSRGKATTAMVLIGVVGSGLTLYYTRNGVFWSTLDFWVGTFLIFVMAGVQAIAFAWFFGIDRGWQQIHEGALIRLPVIIKYLLLYVTPAYLIIVFVGFCLQNLPASLAQVGESPPARLALGLVAAVIVGMVLAVRVGVRRWRAAGLDLDNREPLPPLAEEA